MLQQQRFTSRNLWSNYRHDYHSQSRSSQRLLLVWKSGGLATVLTSATAAVACCYYYYDYSHDASAQSAATEPSSKGQPQEQLLLTNNALSIRPWRYSSYYEWSNTIRMSGSPRSCHCDPTSSNSTLSSSSSSALAVHPSWWRRSLYWCRLASLPLPRYVHSDDPELQLAPRHQRQRLRDEQRIQQLQTRMQEYLQKQPQQSSNNNNDNNTRAQQVAEFALEQYALMYGPSVTPNQRQEFLAKYGCTAWTPTVLQRLVQLGAGRGYVEIGAGHGQWARALTEEAQRERTRFQQQQQARQQQARQQHQSNDSSSSQQPSHLLHSPRDFVLAYDDGSKLPLNPNVYHARTQPHQAYFGQVRPSPSSDPAMILHQWIHRHRILLLVFPTASLAFQSLQAYSAVGPENDTVVYVGEGRGGANAGNDFFQLLQAQGWILQEIHNVHPFGTKGYEKLFVFTKSTSASKEQ